MSDIAVVLMNMGGPDSLDAVQPFLRNLFGDHDLIPLPAGWMWQWAFARMVASKRTKFVRGYYELIGGKSPLGEITRAQADALEARLNRGKPGAFKCHVAMRYTPPRAPAVAEAIAKDGSKKVIALSLYPHYTTATTGSSLRDLKRFVRDVEMVTIDRWPDDALYLDALAAQVKRGLTQFSDEREVELLFSAHGLPESFIKNGEPYVDDLIKTIAGVLQRLGGQRSWRLAFQSRAGKARWLEPSTDQVLHVLAKTGRRDVLAIPISFVSDHIETLYEIDLLFGGIAKDLGLNFKRAPSLNAEPAFIEALAGLVERKI